MVECFDLTNSKRMFEFVFQLYNSVSLAKDNNEALRDPINELSTLHLDVKNLDLQG